MFVSILFWLIVHDFSIRLLILWSLYPLPPSLRSSPSIFNSQSAIRKSEKITEKERRYFAVYLLHTQSHTSPVILYLQLRTVLLAGISMEGDDILLAEMDVKVAPKRDEWMTTLPPERKVNSFYLFYLLFLIFFPA